MTSRTTTAGLLALHVEERLEAVPRRQHLEPVRGELLRKHLPNLSVVVDDQCLRRHESSVTTTSRWRLGAPAPRAARGRRKPRQLSPSSFTSQIGSAPTAPELSQLMADPLIARCPRAADPHSGFFSQSSRRSSYMTPSAPTGSLDVLSGYSSQVIRWRCTSRKPRPR